MSHLNDPFRLPRNVLPHRYEVRLKPDLEKATFSGEVVIHCHADNASEIVMNAKQLEILDVKVNGSVTEWELHDPTERIVLSAPASGDTSISIRFNGTLNDRLRGFYRSTFTDSEGSQRVIATSQMQSTDCRAAFPCFDEPDFKAVFAVTLVAPNDCLAISNGEEIAKQDLGDGTYEIRFSDTMPMSTYLVAFVVGPLEITAPKVVNGVPVRVVHVPGKANLADFGVEAGAFCLNWFHNYYGIPYPAEKVDMVALPDFAAGAMENVGCITYREVLLLVDPETATAADREHVADVIAHELAHMWFGDLVTMKWWNGIWLNEAFATFMGVAACDAFLPELKRWTTFGLERSAAFEVDSLESTRPVEFEVKSPEDSEGMFDLLTYEKGGSLLRMLEMYLGQERFRIGVSHYLKKHAYGNTETNDLWDAIEEIVTTDGGEKVPVRKLMDSWIWQKGYPLVSANVEGDELVLKQQRFSFQADADTSTLWVVPIHVSNAGKESRMLLDQHELRVPLEAPELPVVVNAGGHGFYRVNYAPELLNRLTGATLAALSTLERYQLVDDSWSAVKAGRLEVREFLAFLDGYKAESDLAVWQTIGTALNLCARVIPPTELEWFAQRVSDLTNQVRTNLGWEPKTGEPDPVRQLRGYLVTLAGNLGNDQTVITRCRELWRSIQDSGASVDPELMAAIVSVVAFNGDAVTYDEIRGLYLSAQTPQDEIRYLYALGAFNDTSLITRTCEFAFTEDVRAQDAPFLLNRTMNNRLHGHIAWKTVRARWEEANQKFPINSIIRMVSPASTLTDPELVDDVQQFFADHDIPQATLTLQQTLEMQRVNAALRARTVASW